MQMNYGEVHTTEIHKYPALAISETGLEQKCIAHMICISLLSYSGNRL